MAEGSPPHNYAAHNDILTRVASVSSPVSVDCDRHRAQSQDVGIAMVMNTGTDTDIHTHADTTIHITLC